MGREFLRIKLVLLLQHNYKFYHRIPELDRPLGAVVAHWFPMPKDTSSNLVVGRFLFIYFISLERYGSKKVKIIRELNPLVS